MLQLILKELQEIKQDIKTIKADQSEIKRVVFETNERVKGLEKDIEYNVQEMALNKLELHRLKRQ